MGETKKAYYVVFPPKEWAKRVREMRPLEGNAARAMRPQEELGQKAASDFF